MYWKYVATSRFSHCHNYCDWSYVYSPAFSTAVQSPKIDQVYCKKYVTRCIRDSSLEHSIMSSSIACVYIYVYKYMHYSLIHFDERIVFSMTYVLYDCSVII